MGWLFDFDDGDMAMKMSDDMAMDMDSGEIHITSSWDDED